MNKEHFVVQNYRQILTTIPNQVQLVAVSKTHPADLILELYNAGQRIFGENKVQELVTKQQELPKDIQWHLIGHLQTNKVKFIIPFIHTIQSVDSEKLLIEISRLAQQYQRNVTVFLQIKIAEEDTKYGLEEEQATEIYRNWSSGKYPNVIISGIMGMASFTDNTSQIKQEFTTLKDFFDFLNTIKSLTYLSMGMSSDYPVAIDCGANSVRIGSSIFGERIYKK